MAYRFDYKYSQEADGWLKLHRVPATWQNAYLNCHYEVTGAVSTAVYRAVNQLLPLQSFAEYGVFKKCNLWYSAGAILASPENEKMKSALSKFIDQSLCGVYTGVHATFGKGAYFSIQGTPLSRMPIQWAPNEPDNSDNSEDCLIMLSTGTMADVNCSETFPYFCYTNKTKELNVCGTLDDGYTLDTHTGSCYKVHTSPLNWTRAFVACAREGGHLAIINSAVEAQTIAKLWEKTYHHFVPGKYNKDIAFLGFRNFENHFLWMTIHGQTLQAAGYDRWSDGQPDNQFGHQDCGAMFRNGLLDDNNCDNTLPFICEKDPASLV